LSGEAREAFQCFGGRVAVSARCDDAEARLSRARETLLDAHSRLSRFDSESELSRLNRDPRTAVPASPLLRSLALAARLAGELSDGLVDATLLDEIEALGYVEDVAPGAGPGPLGGPGRAPAGPRRSAGWRSLSVDEETGCVVRPPGVRLDVGGLAKGLLADVVAEGLEDAEVFAVDCCGDIRFGGRSELSRQILVEDPFGGPPVHRLSAESGAVATSGITRRTWRGPDGVPAHQILDPATGLPAMTGVVQATALAPSALHAEVYAKAALLSVTSAGRERLPFGGVLVLEDRDLEVVAPTAASTVAAAI
jgi:thiamine biosynthesis lipoprotein